MTPDQIFTAAQLGEELQMGSDEAAEDAARLIRARDAAIQWAATCADRPLLEISDTWDDACPAWTEFQAHYGIGIFIDLPDIRTVTRVDRVGDDGTPVELEASELATLVTDEAASVQFLVEARLGTWWTYTAIRYTLHYTAGVADTWPKWPLVRQAVAVFAGAHIDGAGYDEAAMAAEMVLSPALLRLY